MKKSAVLVPAVLALLVAVFLPLPARAVQQQFPRYFEISCRDLNQDGIDDFFDDLTGFSSVDIMIVFEAAGYNPTAATLQVSAALGSSQPTAYVSYAATHSPYVFVRRVALSNPPSATPALNAVLNISNVIGIRSYQRFSLLTRQEQYDGALRDGLYFPEEGDGDPSRPLSVDQQIVPINVPGVLVYFVDSGIDKRDYWGIDVTLDNPLESGSATDPVDVSTMKHGSFLKTLAAYTAESAQAMIGGASIQFADVKVAAGPNGETTTEELAKAMDAIVAHVQSERAQGLLFDVVVNISYDTDGGIANHDIIYPSPQGPPVYAPGRLPRSNDAIPLAATGGDPCGGSLFDTVFLTLGLQYGAVICVGAGNDGEVASFAINEVGQSTNTTLVVTALDDRGMDPASWSNFGKAPNGMNGHPDIAAPGTSGAPGFGYLLQGTSVSTAFTSAMAAVKLSVTGPTTPQSIADQLLAEGATLSPVGGKYYGDAILNLPWFPAAEPVQLLHESTDLPRITAAPNPARPVTRLSAEIGVAGPVRAEIFDLAGRLRRCLCDEFMGAGLRSWDFDGRDDSGNRLPGGIYFARVATSTGNAVVRVMLER